MVRGVVRGRDILKDERGRMRMKKGMISGRDGRNKDRIWMKR